MQFWGGVLRRFEDVFGNDFLGDCVCILMIYAVYELCLTLECDRIFIWPCNWNNLKLVVNSDNHNCIRTATITTFNVTWVEFHFLFFSRPRGWQGIE